MKFSDIFFILIEKKRGVDGNGEVDGSKVKENES